MSLGEPFAIGSDDERQVPPVRDLRAESPIEELLAGRGGEQIVTAHDIGDALVRVVDDHRKLVARRSHLHPHEHVPDFLTRMEDAGPGKLILDGFGAGIDHEAVVRVRVTRRERVGLTVSVVGTPRDDRWAQRWGIPNLAILSVWRTRCAADILAASIASKDAPPVGRKVLQSVPEAIDMLALNRHGTVVVEPEPVEDRTRLVDGTWLHPLAIEVFDAEEDLPAEVACQGPGQGEGPGVAEVKAPGRGGGEPCAAGPIGSGLVGGG